MVEITGINIHSSTIYLKVKITRLKYKQSDDFMGLKAEDCF